MAADPPASTGPSAPSRERAPTSTGAKLALVSASLLVALGLCELGLRGADYGGVMEYLPSPRWGYLMRPGQVVTAYGHPVHTNALGLRGPELEAPKGPGTQRYLFVGDSVTYGGGQLRDEELFVRRFEARARAAGHAVEAVNLSAPGWSPQNWGAYIEANGLLDADFVVLILPECDLSRPFRHMEEFGFTAEAPPLRVLSSLSKLREVVWPRMLYESNADAESLKNVEAVRRLAEKAPPGRLLVAFVPGSPSMPPYARHWPKFEPLVPEPLDLRTRLTDPSSFLDPIHLDAVGHARVADALWERLEPTLR